MILLLLANFALPTSVFCDAKSSSQSDTVLKRIQTLENSVENIEAEIEILKAQNRMVIQRTTIGFLNQSYMKGGLSLLVPRSRTFDQRVDTGIGAFLGGGKYLGRNHVIDGELIWDVYPALSLRYRYEFHFESPLFSFGPILGYRVKLFDLKPFDNFIEDPSQVRSGFFVVGLSVGFPMTRSMVFAEMTYMINQQSFLVGNVGIQFFI